MASNSAASTVSMLGASADSLNMQVASCLGQCAKAMNLTRFSPMLGRETPPSRRRFPLHVGRAIAYYPPLSFIDSSLAAMSTLAICGHFANHDRALAAHSSVEAMAVSRTISAGRRAPSAFCHQLFRARPPLIRERSYIRLAVAVHCRTSSNDRAIVEARLAERHPVLFEFAVMYGDRFTNPTS